jgi:acyl-CoA hydrolase
LAVDVAYLEDIRIIAQHDNMVAINNALAIDLTGQIAAEGLGTRMLSTAVTIQRNCADYVVTEYGIAHLWGKSVRQRAQELIAIAHPDFRAELRKEALK